MAITDPYAGISGNALPDAIQALARQHLMQQQGGLINQQAAAEKQIAMQQAIMTRIQQARLPIMLQAYHEAAPGIPGTNTAMPVSPGGMPLTPQAPVPEGPPGAPGAPPAPGVQQQQADQSGVPGADAPNPLDVPVGMPPAAPTQPGPGGSKTSWYNPQAIDQALRERYFVNQAGTPQENQQLYAANLTHDPGLIAAAQMRLQQGIKRRMAEAQYDSSNTFDALTSVVDAGEGHAMMQLKMVAPKVAERLAATVKDPGKQDADARAFAAYMAAEVHQYTGRAVTERSDGFYVDKLTGQPVAGVGRAGPTVAQWEGLAQQGMAPVPVPQSNGTTRMVPRWQAPGQGAATLEDWMMQNARGAGVWGAQPSISGAPQAIVQKQIGQAAQNVQQRQVQAATAPMVAADPTLGKALQDKTFKMPDATPTFGTSITPGAEALQKETALSTANLSHDAKLTTDASQQALMYLDAAKRIMLAKGAPVTGLWGGLASDINRVAPHGIDAANYQVVAKFLAQAALSNARAIYGARMSQMEVKLQLHEMSPSKTMQPAAIMKLLDQNIRNAKYALSSAQRIPVYLAHKMNPMWFSQWNAKYWPQQKIVNAGLSPVTAKKKGRPAPAPGTVMDGYRFKGGNPNLQANWVKVAA